MIRQRRGNTTRRFTQSALRRHNLPVAGTAGVPANVTAVVLNVTVTNPTTDSYLTVYPDGGPGVPTASNLNFVTGHTVANRHGRPGAGPDCHGDRGRLGHRVRAVFRWHGVGVGRRPENVASP